MLMGHPEPIRAPDTFLWRRTPFLKIFLSFAWRLTYISEGVSSLSSETDIFPINSSITAALFLETGGFMAYG